MSAPSTDRFSAWLALALFSAVCLAATETEKFAGTGGNRSAADKWVLSVEILSMSVAFFACVAYLFESVRERFVSKILEISFSVFALILWVAGLPVIMTPTQNAVMIANLYFFSWLSLIAAVMIAGGLLLETQGRDVRQPPLLRGKIGVWCGFAAATIIVMVTSSRIYATVDCGDSSFQGTSFCRRTNLGISLGCISFVSSVVMATAMAKQVLPKNIDLIASAIFLIVWCFGVGFITFGNGPGSTMGNLYFSTWISFILSIVIFAGNFREYASSRGEGAAASQPERARDVEDGGKTAPDVTEVEGEGEKIEL